MKPANTRSRWKQLLGSALFIVLILLAPLTFVLGSIGVSQEEELLASGTRTTGTVVSFDDARKASDRSVAVEYTTSDGVVRTVRALADDEQHPVVGQELTVVHDPANPDRALIEGYDTWAGFAQGLGIFITLIFFAVFALAVLSKAISRIRRRRMPEATGPEAPRGRPGTSAVPSER